MTHRSDQSNRLPVFVESVRQPSALPARRVGESNVWLLVLPFDRGVADAESSQGWLGDVRRWTEGLEQDDIVCVLTSCADAAATWSLLGEKMRWQLWVAVQLASEIPSDAGQLPEHHVSLLIFSKYRTALRHATTRIAYTFCPYCDKTTKDYGGKKHTYNQFGTLLSDVWRDIQCSLDAIPMPVVERLADLFGIERYRAVRVLDLTSVDSLQPQRVVRYPATEPVAERTAAESRLVNGDVLTHLRSMPSESVDFCFADPPYNLDKRYDASDDAIEQATYLDWCDQWLDELARVLRPGCTVAVLNIPSLAVRHFQRLKSVLEFQTWIAWEGLSLPVRMIMPAHYSIICFSKGPPRPLPGLVSPDADTGRRQVLTTLRENYCLRQSCVEARRRAKHRDRQPVSDLWWDIHRLKHNSRRVDHPCQLPPALMRRMIALFSREDEVVLDPFNGAGTTTLCAAAMKRNYIGIELSPAYHQMAMQRHVDFKIGIDPFGKVKRTLTSKNSRVARIGGVEYKIPKKTLQLEVRRVARALGRLPTREDVVAHARFPIEYYDQYFISWGEVCAAARHAGMSEDRKHSGADPLRDEPTLFDPAVQ